MKKLLLVLFLIFGIATMITSCGKNAENTAEKSEISKQKIEQVVKNLLEKYGESQKERIERGVNVVAKLWNGSESEFEKFCLENFVGDEKELEAVFNSFSKHWETLLGNFNRISLDLKKPVHIDEGEVTPLDLMISGYEPSAHLTADFFENKIAYYIALNFPYYSLQEKNELGKNWTRKQWAYARMGDLFTANIPANLLLKSSEAMANADNYISNYNIMAGYLVDDNMNTYFPEEMKLISHWNLRDEIKAQYGKENPLNKQKMIYQVMLRIIDQSIPEDVVNSNKYKWNPFTNKVYQDNKEVSLKSEPDTRYYHLLQNFKALREIDKHNPLFPTYIKAKFEKEMEIPQEEVEKMFVDYCSNPVFKEIGEIIKARLGRELEPFDIWYDGFKSRSLLNQDELTKITSIKYPNPKALEADIPNILTKLGFKTDKAKEIASRISVDPSRGAGHAWGAQMRGEKAHLRTRIGKSGMDYKGYNIAIHELGHNVEQTLTLYDVDYYVLNGVPNTAFTEAWAFTFQSRDLPLLGIKSTNNEKEILDVLDAAWATYEIMGVSLVDMRVWKWLYDNPNANEEQLKQKVIEIAKDVWNLYYAPVFGIKDQPILAIYSHMIDYPLYLSAYPLGHLIEFQIAEYIKDKNLAEEMYRMCVQGRLTPEVWMVGAVGNKLSAEPLLKAAQDAVKQIKNKS
jgi:hypothetical protein